MNLKIVGWVTLAFLAVFAGGWFVGASGRSTLVEGRRTAEEQARFAEARALAFEGRVSLFLVNFGDASTRFQEAHTVVETIQTGLRETGQPERAGRLEIVLAQLREAQRLSAALDQSAQGAATAAIRALDASR